MAFRYQDLVMDVLPAGQKDGQDECQHSCKHSCKNDTKECVPSGGGQSTPGDEKDRGEHKRRYAADLAALQQQLREHLAGAP